MSSESRRITVCDVAPRDGLQNEPVVLEPGVRADSSTGSPAPVSPRIEAVSFVNPARVPQMAGAEEVVAASSRSPGVVYAASSLNERGYARLAETPLDEVHFAFATTESFNMRNQGETVEESVAGRSASRARARQSGSADSHLRQSHSAARSRAPSTRPGARLAGAFAAAGAGRDRPRRHDRRRRRRARCAQLVGEGVELGIPIGVHLHNTRNTGFANAYAAVEAGATVLDAVGRRHWRLPVRAAGDRQHRDRGSRVPAARGGYPDGSTSMR